MFYARKRIAELMTAQGIDRVLNETDTPELLVALILPKSF
jgi:hypothetical protein